jgi:hypothetical protein
MIDRTHAGGVYRKVDSHIAAAPCLKAYGTHPCNFLLRENETDAKTGG